VDRVEHLQTEAYKTRVLIEVAAYPYADRMRNIKARIKVIAQMAAIYLGIEPDRVSIDFREVDFDCWTTGGKY
jgi:phenylpyruvate tautomerase PptA (4-oxalocrotonate tautomerase family)